MVGERRLASAEFTRARRRTETGGFHGEHLDSGFPEFSFLCTIWQVLTLAADIDVLARFGRALADPIRCRILLALREAPAYPSELADTLGISRTRLSNHLACLRDCGLVDTVADGRRTRYELADARLAHALDDLRTAVVAVHTDRTCPDAAEQGCC